VSQIRAVSHSPTNTPLGVRAIYAIVCLMKMWVSVTSSGEVSSIIKQEDLAIEIYTERLVTMFNAIVSRDAQSPHGKFYFVAKRLQQRFAQIKEGARADTADADAARQPSTATTTTTTPPRQPPTGSSSSSQPQSQSQTQTPLHLLSEVAMGSSTSAPHAHTHAQQQAQAQAALQAQSQSQSQMQQQQQQQHQQQQQQQQPWYPAPDVLGMTQAQAQPSFDPNFDFTQFDLGTGSDADLSALFIPDSMMWSFAEQPVHGFPGF
jgi:hypothetical protein